MPVLYVNDTLSGKLVPIPKDGDLRRCTIYTCGPTVYDDAHIGNFRSFLNADVLRRTLELLGHRVLHVMNITDVGHMTEDSSADGGGEDKMAVAGRRIAEAKKSGTIPSGTQLDPSNPGAVADFYADRFLEDACRLGLKVAIDAATLARSGADPGSLMPRPTRCIPQMIEMISELVARRHAYVGLDGAVYFDVRSFPDYGRLSGNLIERLREGAGERIDATNQAAKRHPADFLLWKPDDRHVMRWPSPWGDGYPGWHIECSAMARMLLGDEIDVHTGGEDNIFPHHECEIAQSRCATGSAALADAWFHTRHLQVEGEKMSKSKGNFFTARDLFAKGVTPAAIRLELIRTHYRTNSNFTFQGLHDCQRMIDRWARSHKRLVAEAAETGGAAPDETKPQGPFERALTEFTASLCDDLNVARAIAAVNTAAGSGAGEQTCPHRELSSLLAIDSVVAVLGRNQTVAEDRGTGDLEFAAKVDGLLKRRNEARATKNWAESDLIRRELVDLGITVQDGPSGTKWTRA
jgi:cysteinyl-tRNA synthetase